MSKVQPKFKVGDIIKHKCGGVVVWEVIFVDDQMVYLRNVNRPSQVLVIPEDRKTNYEPVPKTKKIKRYIHVIKGPGASGIYLLFSTDEKFTAHFRKSVSVTEVEIEIEEDLIPQLQN